MRVRLLDIAACHAFVCTSFAMLLVAGTFSAASGQGAVIEYAERGEIRMSINVWGDVSVPGRYIVPAGIDLVELLTIAGGISLSPGQQDVRRTITVNISRAEGAGLRKIYEANVADIIELGADYPDLQHGDMIHIETTLRRTFNFQMLVQTVGALSSLLLLIDRAITISRR